MLPKAFDEMTSAMYQKSADILNQKKEEYSTNEDRLQNFKKAANLQGITPEAALCGMWMKHIVSICDMINEVESCNVDFDIWDEKIIDAINYLILLRGLLVDRSWSYDK